MTATFPSSSQLIIAVAFRVGSDALGAAYVAAGGSATGTERGCLRACCITDSGPCIASV